MEEKSESRHLHCYDSHCSPCNLPLQAVGRSSEEPRHWFGLHQFARLIQMVQNHRVRVDPERVINCCKHLGGMHWVFGWRRTGRIGLAVERPASDAGAGHKGGVAIWPMVTAVGRVAVAGSANA